MLLDRTKAVLLWIVGAMQEMQKLGLVGPGPYELPVKGVALWDQVDMTIKPTDKELEICCQTIIGDDYEPGHKALLIEFRDRRDKMIKWCNQHKKKIERRK